MIFDTARFIVRGWSIDDAEDAFRLYGDPEVLRFLGDGTMEPDRDLADTASKMPIRVARWRGKDGLGMWAVQDKTSGAVLGAVGLFPLLGKGPEVEVAYHIARDAWGRGIAPEVARAAVEYGFSQRGLPEIVAVVYPENARSMRVAEKIGMTRREDREYMGKRLAFFTVEPERPAGT